jgi:hypothetical protein
MKWWGYKGKGQQAEIYNKRLSFTWFESNKIYFVMWCTKNISLV